MNFVKKMYCNFWKYDYFLILITPVIDTINGFFLLKYGATGISVGTFYRLFLILYFCFGIIFNKKTTILYLAPLVFFPFVGIVRGSNGTNLFGCLTYSMKWIFPLILIYYFCYSDDEYNKLLKCVDFWCLFVPISLIIEYFFKIGNVTYYDAGFKGLYFSTNDVSLVLILLYIYSVNKALKFDRKYILIGILNFIAIIILSTKSSIIFSLISPFVLIFLDNKLNKRKVLCFFVIFGLIGFFSFSFLHKQIVDLFYRYFNMWENINNQHFLSRILNFATSGRVDRISVFFQKINEKGNFGLNLLFGWIYPDNAHVIEMDWHDLICQYGLLGFLILFSEYFMILKKGHLKSKTFLYMIIIGLVYSILAGHVISGAFSGTAVALIISLYVLDNYS